jgi:O-glycosyl hydrolase
MRHNRRLAVPVVAIAALLTGVAPALGASNTRVWMTTGDRTNLLKEQSGASMDAPAQGLPEITIDPSQRFQKIDGFGASITDSSAHLIAESPQRDAIMRDLFSTKDGIGLSYLRQPMGASDFVKGPHYTYDDLPAGKTDFGMTNFSVAHDQKQILPLLRQARGFNKNLKVMGTPWSPPAWFKTNDSLVGGRFIDEQRYYQAYAKYFVKFVQAYKRAGVPVDAVTLQNEPQNRHPFEYPGMDFRDNEEAKLVKEVGPAFQRAGIDTKILGYDHNWSLHPNDVGPPGDEANPQYAKSLLDDPGAKRWLDGTAFHCYFGDPSAQSELHDAHPDRNIYFTECSGLVSGDPKTSFPELGEERHHVEPRPGPGQRAAQRRLRHLHGRRDRRSGDGQGHPRGRLLRHGPRDEVRQARRGADRLDGRRQHLGRRVPQSRRLDRRARQQRRLGHRIPALQRAHGLEGVLVRPARRGRRHVRPELTLNERSRAAPLSSPPA